MYRLQVSSKKFLDQGPNEEPPKVLHYVPQPSDISKHLHLASASRRMDIFDSPRHPMKSMVPSIINGIYEIAYHISCSVCYIQLGEVPILYGPTSWSIDKRWMQVFSILHTLFTANTRVSRQSFTVALQLLLTLMDGQMLSIEEEHFVNKQSISIKQESLIN